MKGSKWHGVPLRYSPAHGHAPCIGLVQRGAPSQPLAAAAAAPAAPPLPLLVRRALVRATSPTAASATAQMASIRLKAACALCRPLEVVDRSGTLVRMVEACCSRERAWGTQSLHPAIQAAYKHVSRQDEPPSGALVWRLQDSSLRCSMWCSVIHRDRQCTGNPAPLVVNDTRGGRQSGGGWGRPAGGSWRRYRLFSGGGACLVVHAAGAELLVRTSLYSQDAYGEVSRVFNRSQAPTPAPRPGGGWEPVPPQFPLLDQVQSISQDKLEGRDIS